MRRILLKMICSALNTIDLYITLGLKILGFAELGSAMLKAMAHLNQSLAEEAQGLNSTGHIERSWYDLSTYRVVYILLVLLTRDLECFQVLRYNGV